MDLSFIIVNYKHKGLLRQCLRGLFDDLVPFSYEVIVVDNNSGDGSVEMVREEFPKAHMISSRHNGGFAYGINLGIRQASGKFYMILNSDIVIFKGAVENMQEYFLSHPNVGMVVPKLLNPDGTPQSSCYRFPSMMIPVYRRTILGKLPWAKRALNRFLMSDWDHRSSRPIGWALGGCLYIRKEALDQVGLFDERYFLYFEDVDICRRFWEYGWEVHYVHTAHMAHYHHRESAEHSGLKALFAYPTRVHIKAAIKYYLKFIGHPKPAHSV